jgi:hypothetical protein
MSMIRNLCAGVAALALMTGAAYAQDSGFYQQRTVTTTTPFGESRTTTTTTAAPVEVPPPPPIALAPPPPMTEEQSADIVAEPVPGPAPNYDRVTTTRQIGPDGVEIRRNDRVERRQSFYDGDGELSARTTTRTRSSTTTYGPAPVYRPNPAAAGFAPAVELPPYPNRTTVTTTTQEGE